MRVGIFIILFVLSTSMSITSEPPSQAQGIVSQPQQNKASDDAQITNTNQHDTGQASRDIKVHPADKANDDAPQSKKEKEENASADWWIVRLTAVLAFVGFLQLIVFGLQASRLRQTIDEMKNATKATEKAANATEKSVELAREEFNLTHRPRIIVRGVSINTGTRSTFEIEFVIANIGDTRATIIQRSTKLWMPESLEYLPAELPYGDPSFEITPLDLGVSVGQTHHATADIADEYRIRLTQGFSDIKYIDISGIPIRPILFIGYIIYEDNLKRQYHTAFMRIYDYRAKRFKRSAEPDPDYEYQD